MIVSRPRPKKIPTPSLTRPPSGQFKDRTAVTGSTERPTSRRPGSRRQFSRTPRAHPPRGCGLLAHRHESQSIGQSATSSTRRRTCPDPSCGRWMRRRHSLDSATNTRVASTRCSSRCLPRGVSVAHDRAILRDLLALAPPGIDELYALSVLGDALHEGRFDCIVVDPAPTGHLLRPIEMPALALDWNPPAHAHHAEIPRSGRVG